MMSLAVRHEILDQNQCSKIQKYRDEMCERAITEEEAQRLWIMIDEAQKAWVISKDFADIFRLIMLTGARRTEIAALRWSEVDLERARLVLPPVRTKMGALNRARTIALSAPAIEVLQRVKRRSEHVFPSSVGDKAASLKSSLPEGMLAALAELVRSMNCYYSNLIEGHDTHPIDIERALNDELSRDPKNGSFSSKRKLACDARFATFEAAAVDPTLN